MIDKTVLDNIIVGRVEPHIYAFTTNTIPNYLKVGDTYRPVAVRLQEWREHYPELEQQYEHSAKINDEVYFRDFAVHQFLESDKKKARLLPTDISEGVYYSKEFFKDTDAEEVREAILDIERDYRAKTNKYQFYNAESHLPETFTFARVENYDLRPNQDKTVKAFRTARENGRKNLLMYAVMRFGKSFTSMCCALDMGAKLVVVVSAKADVLLEWKKTVESHIKFADYDFLASKDLLANNHIVTEKLTSGKKVVVFLTLQDLQGSIIKDKHQEIFGQKIDLLLVDETHFGARAEKYGAVLKPVNYQVDINNKKDGDDFIDIEEADATIKVLNTDMTIHLSGTPYRILMGSEFKKEDIIAFYQFTDIVSDKEAWDKQNILNDDYKEWDNPYYGFPQMVRFAFNPNESSRKRLEELKKSGTTYAFSALFKPLSIKKDKSDLHKKFKYESEILELLEVIDGSKNDENLLGFLDYEKIKEGKMCRHIVIVLPYCASCDALEVLIRNNADKFHNLNEYEIINISGVDNPNSYNSPEAIKEAIRKHEEKGKKTITLTVNRMLTGSTVPEWDTMLYLKDTASPQEYDQAIFRLQNQYVKTYIDKNGDTIKYNMKPQTLLVDFDPSRMFVMQETKSKIYNVNVDTGGNSELEKRICEELRISPIVTLNADKIVEVNAIDILKVVSNYQKNKGIREEALEIPVDLSILDDEAIRSVIERENEIGSKAGLSTPAHEGSNGDKGSEVEIPEPPLDDENTDEDETPPDNTPTTTNEQRKKELSLTKKIKSYYTRILLFAYITKDTVISLSDILDKIDSTDNLRIAQNLGLSKAVLSLMCQKSNKFVLSDLDYKIQDLNELSRSTEMPPEERASVAVSKFGKLGDAIVITPSNICDDMVSQFPADFLRDVANRGGRILDIAGTAGEYAVAIYKKLSALGIDNPKIANAICTIPKSSVCYELIRKLYEMLGLNVDNIASKFIAADLLDIRSDDSIDYGKIKALLAQNKTFSDITLTDDLSQGGTENMITFDAVIGNPPYQIMDGGAQASATPVYNMFVEVAKNINPEYISMIMPSRWMTGGKGLDKFRLAMIRDKHIIKLVDYFDASSCFPNVEIKGGVCYFLWNKSVEDKCDITTHIDNSILQSQRYLCESDDDFFIRDNRLISIKERVAVLAEPTFDTLVSSMKPYGIRGDAFKDTKKYGLPDFSSEVVEDGYSIVGLDEKLRRVVKYMGKDYPLPKQDMLHDYKIFITRNYGIGELGEIPASPILAKPGMACTETFVQIGPFANQQEMENCFSYMKTKFFRLMVGIRKHDQGAGKAVYSLVPLQDFSKSWTDEELYRKYNLSPEDIDFIEQKIKKYN